MSSPQIPDIIKLIERPLYRNKSFVHQKYVVEGLSLAQIASKLFVSKEAVRKALKDFNIPIREAHKPHGRQSQPRYGEKKQLGKTVPHMAEKRVIGAIIEMREDGLTLRQVAAYLDKIGVPTKNRGKKWHPEMVKRILVNSTELTVVTTKCDSTSTRQEVNYGHK